MSSLISMPKALVHQRKFSRSEFNFFYRWKKKQMRHTAMFSKNIQEVSSEQSLSLTDDENNNSDELPGDKESDKQKQPEKKTKKNSAI